MASTASPTCTFVIVPGHWHTLSHLTPLVDALRERGYHARPLQLHSVGAKSTRPTFSDDVCVIYSAIVQELIRGNDVCLVVHSYAGMPGAEAVNKIVSDGALEPGDGRGRLIRTVFIAAYTFPAGFVMDVRAMLGPENPAFEIDVHTSVHIPSPPLTLLTSMYQNDNILHITSPWHNLFNDLPLSAAKPYVDSLAPTYYLGPSFTFAPTPTATLSPSRTPFTRARSGTGNASNSNTLPNTSNASNTTNPALSPLKPTRALSPAPPERPSTPTSQRQKNDAAGPVLSSDKWRRAHVRALLCSKDNLIPAERQEKMWKGVPREWVEGGHVPFVSRAGEVVGVLVRAVEGEEGEEG